MKLIFTCSIFLIIMSCSRSVDPAVIDDCLSQINDIGSEHTFREAMPVAEKMVKKYPSSARLKIRLADLYFLEYLIDDQEEALTKTQQQITEAIKADPSFSTINVDLKKDKEFLMEFKQIWEAAVAKGDRNEIENLLLWALAGNFDENSKLSRIKSGNTPQQNKQVIGH